MCQIKLLYLYCLVVVGFSESEADDLELALQDKPGIRRKVCQIKLLYLYCLVVVGFSESEADDLELALPRQTRNKKKGVSN